MRNCCKEKMVVRNLAAVAQMVARGVQMTWARQFPAVYFAPMMMMVVESWMIVFSWFIFQDQVYVSTIMIHFMSPTITSMVNILLLLIIFDRSVIAWVVKPVISNQSSFMCLKSEVFPLELLPVMSRLLCRTRSKFKLDTKVQAMVIKGNLICSISWNMLTNIRSK